MRKFIRPIIVSAGLFAGYAAPAAADVTAQEVWAELQTLYEGIGYKVEAETEVKAGETLTLNEVTATFSLPEEAGSISIKTDWIKLRETGDGAVEMTLSAVSGIDALITPKGEDDVEFAGHIDSGTMSILISGSPDNLRLQSTAEKVVFKLDSLIVDGENIPAGFTLTSTGSVADYMFDLRDTDLSKMSGTFALDAMSLVVNANEPDGGKGLLVVNGDLSDLSGRFDMALPKEFDPETLFSSGFDIDAEYDFGKSDFEVLFQDRKDRFAMTGSAEGGHIGTIISAQRIAYDISERGVEVSIAASELPIPSINLGYDEVSLAFDIPLAQSNVPSDYRMGMAVRGLTVSEAIWSMFDPTQLLPRDPATVVLDITGKMMVLADLTDPEKLARMDEPPMIPVSVNLDELTASLAGALLTGSGSVDINMNNMEAFDGMPQPIGEVNLYLKGGFGLLDKLGQMGLVPPDASMGIRAMMGAFAKPVGEDEFETKIEMTEDGSVLANGQRIK